MSFLGILGAIGGVASVAKKVFNAGSAAKDLVSKNGLSKQDQMELAKYQSELELERMAVSNQYAVEAAAQSQQYNKELFDYTFSKESAWNEKMRDEQRQYDDPAAEMARLKNAGVNPALYYANGSGGGGSGIGTMGVSPSASGAQQSATPAIAPMGLQVALQAQQVELAKRMNSAQIGLVHAQTAKTLEEAENEGGVNREKTKAEILKSKAETLRTETETANNEADLKKKAEEIKILAEQAKQEALNTEQKEGEMAFFWQNLTVSYHTALANFENMLKDRDLKEKQIQVIEKELEAFDTKLQALVDSVENGKTTAEAAREQASVAREKVLSEIVKNYADAGVDSASMIEALLNAGTELAFAFIGMDKRTRSKVKRAYKKAKKSK